MLNFPCESHITLTLENLWQEAALALMLTNAAIEWTHTLATAKEASVGEAKLISTNFKQLAAKELAHRLALHGRIVGLESAVVESKDASDLAIVTMRAGLTEVQRKLNATVVSLSLSLSRLPLSRLPLPLPLSLPSPSPLSLSLKPDESRADRMGAAVGGELGGGGERLVARLRPRTHARSALDPAPRSTTPTSQHCAAPREVGSRDARRSDHARSDPRI
jgi:hypothetical protein